MTKDQYFEMCEMMGTDPIDSEIPLEYEDLHEEVQEALGVYNMLQDNWDSMNGVYLGKVLVGISEIFDIMDVTDAKTIYYIISLIDKQRSEVLNARHKQKSR